jgi:hypothetical protein
MGNRKPQAHRKVQVTPTQTHPRQAPQHLTAWLGETKIHLINDTGATDERQFSSIVRALKTLFNTFHFNTFALLTLFVKDK